MEFAKDGYWTDIFIFLVEIPAVEEGALLAFFSDLNPENTKNTICFQQVEYVRELLKTIGTTASEGSEVMTVDFWTGLQSTIDMDLEMLQAFDDCAGNDLIVTMGQKVTSASGAISAMTNTGYQMMFMLLDEAWQQGIVDTVNKANLSQDDEDWKEVGYFAGAIVSQLLEF